MYEALSDAATYLSALSLAGLLGLFWFTVIFEVPRYTLSFLSAAVYRLRSRPMVGSRDAASVGRVTVVVAGYNEEDSIRNCVLSLREQSLAPHEIIVVSDGSTDNMPKVLSQLLNEGLIDRAHSDGPSGRQVGGDQSGRALGDRRHYRQC